MNQRLRSADDHEAWIAEQVGKQMYYDHIIEIVVAFQLSLASCQLGCLLDFVTAHRVDRNKSIIEDELAHIAFMFTSFIGV